MQRYTASANLLIIPYHLSLYFDRCNQKILIALTTFCDTRGSITWHKPYVATKVCLGEVCMFHWNLHTKDCCVIAVNIFDLLYIQ